MRRRVTEDRVSISIPRYNQPHSIVEAAKVAKRPLIELVGDVTCVDDDDGKVTVNLGVAVTVEASTIRLVTRPVAPKRKTPPIGKAT